MMSRLLISAISVFSRLLDEPHSPPAPPLLCTYTQPLLLYQSINVPMIHTHRVLTADIPLRVPPGSTGALQKVFRWTDAVLQLLQVGAACR